MESSSSDPQQPIPAPTPTGTQQQPGINNTNIHQPQPIQPKSEPQSQPISLQIQSKPPTPQPTATQSSPIAPAGSVQTPTSVQEQTTITTPPQQPIQQLQVHPTTNQETATTSITSQPFQLQVQCNTTQAPTTPQQPTTVVVTQASPITTQISTAQIPHGLPTIQIRPQGPTLALTTPSLVTTTSPVVATNLAVSNQQTTTTTPTLTPTPAIIKAEPYRFICCLLDNGVRCDRIAGNASFNLRIQKVVATKKLNFELDPKVTHGYICEYHKGIITVAKKSTTIPRGDSKARNYNANANNNPALEAVSTVPIGSANNIAYTTQPAAHQRGSITTLQQPVNLKLITSNNQRLANNHHPNAVPVGTTLSTIPIVSRQGIAYAHYQPAAAHQNQITKMDVMMSNYDNTGGDNVANMGSSSSGIDVDLQQLQVNTLRRYKRHFRVQTRPGLNKMQLAESLKSHFRTLPIIEKEAITYFVYIVKCFRNKLDHNPKAD